MKWGVVGSILSGLVLSAPAEPSLARSWPAERILSAREATRGLWQHGFDSYMHHAFPLDELSPLTCTGQGPDWNDPTAIHFNDVNANISLTLIDNLDSFVVLSNKTGFAHAVKTVVSHVSFDVDTKPQVFEVTIRALGGLLSGHFFASDKKHGFQVDGYRGELLRLAYDLGERLLPAFETATGIPYARVNLRHGVKSGESFETCTAGAGSLLLEFTTLSRWTGDDRFEKAARRAFFAVWNRRSKIGLLGNGINVRTGAWIDPGFSGIGAGIDSFYEYALKMYVMTGESQYLDVWNDSYDPIMEHSRGKDGFWYRTVSMFSGELAVQHIDSLGAFWPGLQVLAGDIESAIKSHLVYWNLWKRFSGIPETFNVLTRQAISLGYPLRPEFIESTYFLYRATRDSFYLDVGARILEDLTRRTKVPCGLSTISNLLTDTRENRMESFALSESLKYLYLLFDEANPLNSDSSDFVFTTEGHMLPIMHVDTQIPSPSRPMYQSNHTLSERDPRLVARGDLEFRIKLQCPAYRKPLVIADNRQASHQGGLTGSIRDRSDFEYARLLAGISSGSERAIGMGFPAAKAVGHELEFTGPTPTSGSPLKKELSVVTDVDKFWWRSDGWCDATQAEEYVLEWIISPDGRYVVEDNAPSSSKISLISGGFMIHNISGLRLQASARVDRSGYDVTKIGPYWVPPGETVFIKDPALLLQEPNAIGEGAVKKDSLSRIAPDVFLRFSHILPGEHAALPDAYEFPLYKKSDGEIGVMLDCIASTATFGGNPGLPRVPVAGHPDLPISTYGITRAPLLFGPESPYNGAIRVIRAEDHNEDGCDDHHPQIRFGHMVQPQDFFSAPGEDYTPTPSSSAPPADLTAAAASVLFVRRGGCTFFRKLVAAKEAGFAGLIVWNAQDEPGETATMGGLVNPSIELDEREFAERELNDVAVVVVGREDGAAIDAMIRLDEGDKALSVGFGGVVVEVFTDAPPLLQEDAAVDAQVQEVIQDAPAEDTPSQEHEATKKPGRILYINGLALKNTILV